MVGWASGGWEQCNREALSEPANLCSNSSPPGQNGRHFADDIFRCISVNEGFRILIRISLKFVPKGPVDKPSIWRQGII